MCVFFFFFFLSIFDVVITGHAGVRVVIVVCVGVCYADVGGVRGVAVITDVVAVDVVAYVIVMVIVTGVSVVVDDVRHAVAVGIAVVIIDVGDIVTRVLSVVDVCTPTVSPLLSFWGG